MKGNVMTNDSIKIGISFSSEMIRLIEVERWNGKLNLTNALQIALPKSFDPLTIGDVKSIPLISDTIDKACEHLNPQIKTAKICIDRKLALKKTFAVDKGLLENEIRQHIEWELEQLLIAPRDEYNVGFEQIIFPKLKNDVVVFAAIRKAIVQYLRDIFAKSRFQLDSVDLDVFASLRTLAYAYPDKLRGITALIEFLASGIGITILYDGKYALSSEMPSVINEKKYQHLSTPELASAVRTELNKLLEHLKENLDISPLNRILVAGENADKSLVAELNQQNPEAVVAMVEPFQNAHRQLNIESQKLIDEHGECFVACFGMVL